MIPIVSIINSVSFLVCLFAFMRLFRSYKEPGQKNEFVGNFMKFYLFMTFFFGLVILPGVVLLDNLSIIISTTISTVSLYIAILYFIVIPLNMWGAVRIKKLVIMMVIITIIITLTLVVRDTIINIDHPEYKFIDEYYYIVADHNIITRTLMSLISGITAFFGGLFFIINGLDPRADFATKKRSFFIGGGMLFLIAASISNYLILRMSESPIMTVVSSIFAVFGLVIMLLGILQKNSAQQ